MLLVAGVLTKLDFNVLWRYFSWSNQTLAMITLWVITSYLLRNRKKKRISLISAVPATFMTAVSVTYILIADEGFKFTKDIAYPSGIGFAIACFIGYLIVCYKVQQKRNARKESERSNP